jgi:hypothetical protein
MKKTLSFEYGLVKFVMDRILFPQLHLGLMVERLADTGALF